MMLAWLDSPRTKLRGSPPSRTKSPNSNPSRRWSFRQPQRHGEATRFGIIRRLWASALAAAGPSYVFSALPTNCGIVPALVAGRAHFWSAAGSEAPRRFGFGARARPEPWLTESEQPFESGAEDART